MGKPSFPFYLMDRWSSNKKSVSCLHGIRTVRFWRDSKAVMQRPAKPFRPVRLRLAPPSSKEKALRNQGFFFFRPVFKDGNATPIEAGRPGTANNGASPARGNTSSSCALSYKNSDGMGTLWQRDGPSSRVIFGTMAYSFDMKTSTSTALTDSRIVFQAGTRLATVVGPSTE